MTTSGEDLLNSDFMLSWGGGLESFLDIFDAPALPPSAEPASRKPKATAECCWGAQLLGNSSQCTPGFTGGTGHFKWKFCPQCRKGISVPAAKIRALTPELHQELVNYVRMGFWNSSPPQLGLSGEYRIVNNTMDCAGPRLAVFKGEPFDLPWAPLPPLADENGMVDLYVARGTLIPRLCPPRCACAGFPATVWHGMTSCASLPHCQCRFHLGRGRQPRRTEADAQAGERKQGRNTRRQVVSAPDHHQREQPGSGR